MAGVSRKQLIWLCHSMATMLDAGLPVARALEVLGAQARGALGRALRDARARLDRGDTLAEALAAQRKFPPLLLHLVSAGEASGTLEAALAELARYYEFQHRVWRRFLGQIILPVAQYIIAVAVVSFATYVLHMLAGEEGSFVPGLLIGYGIPAALIASYLWLLKPLGATRACHEALLRLPLARSVALPLALSRFSLVMYMTSEAGVPVREALVKSFGATGNAAFAARGELAAETVHAGRPLTDALRRTGLFPKEYLDVVAVAEESGKLSERFRWLADHYGDKAEFALAALASALARLIWACVAGVIVVFIFQIFSRYLGALRGAGL